ncbi:general transcription factor 3C polypeptide 5-like [Clytia hemisphaerica]|uniref:General transcription factor 3C polypeptide 5 n=1 Tax=Clytia hemisphaerica TaxID=252671 RepID=A0A7M5WMA5_9CNID
MEVKIEDEIQNDPSRFKKVTTKRLVFIEYPGFIKNVDKMLATLGGEEKISETYRSGKQRLQMTYRPEDLNAHNACADLLPFTGLLLKVRRRRKKGTDEFEYEQDIVGISRDRYRFQTLMDYQYLTPEPLWNYFKSIHTSELGNTDFPPYFAPPVFARLDSAGVYQYKPDLVTGIKTVAKAPEIGIDSIRKRRHTESMAALYSSADVPSKPTEKACTIIENLNKGPDADAIKQLELMFNERPLWSKLAISCLVDVTPERLKKVLQYFAYYWLSGPWRTLWCRMGYDPRKDPKAKRYQMVEFRLRRSKENKKCYKMMVPARRSNKDYLPRNLRNIVSRAPASKSVLAACNEPENKEEGDKEPYIFHPNKMIHSRSMMLQLCDIHDPAVQKIIVENDGMETRCDEREGWFPQGTMGRIRNEMTKTVDAYFERQYEKQKSENLSSDKTGGGEAGVHSDVQGEGGGVKEEERFREGALYDEDMYERDTEPPSSTQMLSYTQMLQGDDDYSMDTGQFYDEEEFNVYA